jgi:lipopolysaccharide export system protein LptA
LTIPGPVTFTKGRMKGSGVGATYDRNRDVIWLLADARISVAPDAAGAGAIDGSAAKAGLARADNFVKLEGTGRLTTETRTAEADVITAYLDEKGEKVRTMELREHSRITGSGANAERMTARNIDLMYADDGRTLQSSKLMEGSVLEFPGTGGAGSKRIAGTTIETRMSPDGATMTNLTAQEKVQVDLPVEGDSPARRIRSATLRATGAPGQGIQNAIFEGGVDFAETRPAGKTPALDRRARSIRLTVDTRPGFGAVERADFRGNVRFVDGELTAEAPKAIYDIARDQLDLSLGNGEVGPNPILNNAQMTVQALNIQVSPSTQKLKADTDVRTILKPKKAAPASAPGGRGAPPAARSETHVPAMLKADKQVTVTSNRFEYDGIAEATYSGKAFLWQDKSRIEAETIVMNDRTGNLTGQSNVRTTMFFEEEDPKTKVRSLTETRANADMLVYDDAKRLATYTATGTAPASLKNAQGDMSGKRIDLFLKEGGSELDRAEADGDVAVKLDALFATCRHLVYTAATNIYVLTGEPVVSVTKDKDGSCKETRGNTVTYRRALDSTSVGAIAGVATETKPIPACPAELRR